MRAGRLCAHAGGELEVNCLISARSPTRFFYGDARDVNTCCRTAVAAVANLNNRAERCRPGARTEQRRRRWRRKDRQRTGSAPGGGGGGVGVHQTEDEGRALQSAHRDQQRDGIQEPHGTWRAGRHRRHGKARPMQRARRATVNGARCRKRRREEEEAGRGGRTRGDAALTEQVLVPAKGSKFTSLARRKST